ncbi:response regulator [Shinella sp. 838]|uniref:response regulator n=1 Tax=unclassified Shinella TaxID=2643062 RepID=UPI0018D164EA|nr:MULTISPECIES: response regulator [unclassified Shinella]MDG4676330.1 response regulator [Shinella sp. 838]
MAEGGGLMRILLVEDNVDFAASIEKAIRGIDGCEVTWRHSRLGALTAIAEELFDVVILDRRIPTEDDFLDDHQDHGWAVFQAIAEQLPGTSVWFLTGTVDPDFPVDMLRDHGRRGDIHCCGREDPIHQVFWKNRMNDCVAAVRSFRAEVQRTDQIHLEYVDAPVNLRGEEMRLLRLFGRTHGGSRVEVRQLAGGLSGARVLRVTVFNAAGAAQITSVARLGVFSEIAVEKAKYHSEVVRLAPGSFPQVTAEIALGAGSFASIFYGVVGAEVRSLFDILTNDPIAGAAVPAQVRADHAIWHGARQIERLRVSTIRRSVVGDVVLQGLGEELAGLDLGAVEAIEVDAARCMQHGDLHCANVLFDDFARPMVIDYPEIGRSLASLDPVALELSTIFHTDAPDRAGWPTENQAIGWTEIDLFCAGSPYEAYIRACRAWALGVAGSEQEVWAVGYSYALRQLKYRDTDKILARAIIRGCMERLLRGAEGA